jgi:hypothetical protein
VHETFWNSVGCGRPPVVWDSQEHLDAFASRLMPILAEFAIDPGQPEVLEVHNIIKP